jgi:aconitate hydratase
MSPTRHPAPCYGPGVAELKTMDRHVIANMGVEVGAVTTIFPSDDPR